MPDQPIPDDVRQALDRFTQQAGIEITEHARQLLAHIIEGVVRDPHPSWQVSPSELQRHRQYYVRALPDMLTDLATRIAEQEGSRRGQPLNTFDLLHGLRGIDAFCVIPKVTARLKQPHELTAPLPS